MGSSRKPQRLRGVAGSSDDEISGFSPVACRLPLDLDAGLLEAGGHRRQLRPLVGPDDHRMSDLMR
ncbi:hypothetical protein [Geodermatophilus sabuli]|uniref:hypothetical protein n=1 Tax=Geodermatophilus sabuli TaxID=1564158 RepID=UPI000BE44EC7|nr:hypothetical protein [Geodermatophilus sabuli]MBB3086889.1 hypothetical protein [Geodermatophilus sabuli]